MIYISLEDDRIDILDRRKINYSLPLILPLILKINKVVSLLNKQHNVVCNVSVKIGNIVSLEVFNV